MMNRADYDKHMSKFNDMRRGDPRFIFARRVAIVMRKVLNHDVRIVFLIGLIIMIKHGLAGLIFAILASAILAAVWVYLLEDGEKLDRDYE